MSVGGAVSVAGGAGSGSFRSASRGCGTGCAGGGAYTGREGCGVAGEEDICGGGYIAAGCDGGGKVEGTPATAFGGNGAGAVPTAFGSIVNAEVVSAFVPVTGGITSPGPWIVDVTPAADPSATVS